MCGQVPSHGLELPLGGGETPSKATPSGSDCCKRSMLQFVGNFLFQCDGAASPRRASSCRQGHFKWGTEMFAWCHNDSWAVSLESGLFLFQERVPPWVSTSRPVYRSNMVHEIHFLKVFSIYFMWFYIYFSYFFRIWFALTSVFLLFNWWIFYVSRGRYLHLVCMSVL